MLSTDMVKKQHIYFTLKYNLMANRRITEKINFNFISFTFQLDFFYLPMVWSDLPMALI